MDFLKKNKVVAGIFVGIIFVVAGIWFFAINKNAKIGPNSQIVDETQNVKQISAEDIGLEVELKPNKQAVIMRVTKLDGIASIEYEVSYDAEEEFEGETSVVPKGAGSSEPIDVRGKSEIEREILLGTCSARVCRYDKVMSDIKVLVRVNYENGGVAAAEATVPFDSSE